MEDRYRAFGQKFSAAIIAKDDAAVQALLAPWLQVDALREAVDQHVRGMCQEWGIDEEIYPTECQLDGNVAIKVEHLREPDWDDSIPEIPEQLTDENFRYWMSLQFMPAEGAVEFDAFFDLWLAVVEDDGGLRAGYYKFTDPD
ncbi:MAG: hypothetical protein JWO36_4548 [Myxococcales bacterium]|nr:hypothetical protein [Myxococcales bacterium]